MASHTPGVEASIRRGALSSFDVRFHQKLETALAQRNADKDTENRQGVKDWDAYQFNVGYAAALKDVLEDADLIHKQLME